MALAVRKGVLTSPGATGQQTYNISTGDSWPASTTPKFLALWATYETADGRVGGDGIFSIGVATFDGGAVQQGFITVWDDDASASADTVRSFNNDAVLRGLDSSVPGTDYNVTFVSFASDSFTLDWTDLPATASILVHYEVFGGSDLAAARIGTFQTSVAAATQDVTVAAGWGEPSVVLFLGSGNATAFGSTANSIVGFGAGIVGGAGRFAQITHRDTAGSMDLTSTQKNRALLTVSSTATPDSEADLVTGATDGFRLSYSDQAAIAARSIFVALKGTFTATINKATAPTAAAPQNQDLALASGTPKGALLWGTNLPANAGVDSTHADLGYFFLGGSDGTNEGHAGVGSDDADTTSIAGRFFSSTKAIAEHTPGAAPVLASEADASVNGTDLRLVWNDTDSVAREFGYIIFGETAGGPTEVPLAAASGLATATLAVTSPTAVTLGVASAAASATLALKATTQVTLGVSSAGVTTTLTVSAQTQVPLGAASAVASPTLALGAQTQVPLGASSALASTALAVTAATQLPLASSSSAAASPTLVISAATTLPLAAASGACVTSLAVSAATQVSLAASSAVASDSLALTVATTVALDAASGTASTTLALTATTQVPSAASSGSSSATVALTAQTQIPLGASSAVSSATCQPTTSGEVILGLAPAGAVATPTLAVSATTQLPLGTASAAAGATLGLYAPGPVLLPLGDSTGTLAATLALAALTGLPFAPVAATSSATLVVTAPLFSPFTYGGTADSSYGGTAAWSYTGDDDPTITYR